MLLGIFAPKKAAMRAVALPFWIGYLIGVAATGVSSLLGRKHPLFEPSLYGLYSGSKDLDFSGRKLAAFFARHGERMVTRDEGLAELARLARPAHGAEGQGSASGKGIAD